MKIKIGIGKINIGTLVDLCNGEVVGNPKSEFSFICTDSREADSETLFIAMKGERCDGYDYIEKAAEQGCTNFICEKAPKQNVIDKGCAAFVIDNAARAIAEISKNYRKKLPCKCIGVTGSVGKTTTKEFIFSVLNQKFKTGKTEGNHNSIIGMPMSVLRSEPLLQYLVLEMGMEHIGEISSLSKIGCPDISVITNIGNSHLETLGSRENICSAKLEIVDGMTEGGLLLLNGDEPLLENISRKGLRVKYFSLENESSDFRAVNIESNKQCTTFDVLLNGLPHSKFSIPTLGKHNVYAALIAFAIGKELGFDDEDIRKGLLDFHNVAMRQEIKEYKGITVIRDCYNASPESMRASINMLSEYAKERKMRPVALLGDMLNLGEQSEELHRSVGEYFSLKLGDGLLITYGERAASIAEGARANGFDKIIKLCAEAPDSAALRVRELLSDNDVLLVKASRGMKAEKIIDSMILYGGIFDAKI